MTMPVLGEDQVEIGRHLVSSEDGGSGDLSEEIHDEDARRANVRIQIGKVLSRFLEIRGFLQAPSKPDGVVSDREYERLEDLRGQQQQRIAQCLGYTSLHQLVDDIDEEFGDPLALEEVNKDELKRRIRLAIEGELLAIEGRLKLANYNPAA